ncbi:MAG: GntR family transcriptional regulator [Aestuariivirga sp.]|uniref:GntR family transcriptional regulator n=1 Tax=Aestuariivirga sp. TaxID=2650926 RepID=UPI0025C57C85|nr:GntR family transcriptional regulator [Aestuariivirga sp.]MCA3562150.1 GntR family transcriptional regulator [Aestuariivirga sp.]
MSVAAVTYDFLSPGRTAAKGATARVYAALREAIVQLDLKPGEFLDKQAIALRMGVSRFPVGEAMNRLAAEGLADIIPQSGSRVAFIKISDTRENMFLRRALEAETVRRLAPHASAALIEQLASNLRYQKVAIDAQDLKGFHGFDLAFHALLQDYLGFERVRGATETARLGLDRVRQLLNTRRRLELTLAEHEAILAALEAHDGDAAGKAMCRHLDAVMAELETFARERPELFADLNSTGGIDT